MIRPGRRKVLIVARHPSAGGGVLALAAEARRRKMDVEVFATGHALAHLLGRRLPGVLSFATARTRYPQLPPYTGPERVESPDFARPRRLAALVDGMAAWLSTYLIAARIDAVLATDATEQLGPDQLVALAATRSGVPCLRVRDGWGIGIGIETRRWRGRLPEPLRREALAARYLEIDQTGSDLSVRHLGLPRERMRALNGLYTLDRFAGRATRASRARARRRLGIGREPLVLVFTQPTRREAAEVDFVQTLAAALTEERLADRRVVVATLEHPREGDQHDGRLGLHWTAACVTAGYRGRVLDLSGVIGHGACPTFEDAMIAADVVVSSYSNVSIEATVLGATAAGVAPGRQTIGMHSLAPSIVRKTFRRSRAGLEIGPVAAMGGMPCALRAADVGPLVKRLLFSAAAREGYFRVLRRHWHPGAAAPRVIDEVISAMRTS